MILYFKERRKEMKKNLFSIYIILAVIGLTSIFLFPTHGKTEAICYQRDVSGACVAELNIIMQSVETVVENAALAGQATLISPWMETFDNTPTYTWYAVTDATWYHIWINTSTGTLGEKWYTAAEVGCPAGTGTCSLTAPAELAPGTYTWWIQAWYNAYGPWSDGMPFWVDPNGKNCQIINAAGFTPVSSNTTYDSSAFTERYRTGGTGNTFHAPLHLPAGAQITNIFLDYFDNDATGDVWAFVARNTPGSASGYGTKSSGTPGYGRVEGNISGVNFIVDNAGSNNFSVMVLLGATGPTNKFLDVIICHKPIP